MRGAIHGAITSNTGLKETIKRLDAAGHSKSEIVAQIKSSGKFRDWYGDLTDIVGIICDSIKGIPNGILAQIHPLHTKLISNALNLLLDDGEHSQAFKNTVELLKSLGNDKNAIIAQIQSSGEFSDWGSNLDDATSVAHHSLNGIPSGVLTQIYSTLHAALTSNEFNLLLDNGEYPQALKKSVELLKSLGNDRDTVIAQIQSSGEFSDWGSDLADAVGVAYDSLNGVPHGILAEVYSAFYAKTSSSALILLTDDSNFSPFNVTGTSEFRINDYSPSMQLYPAIAGLSFGGFVSTWASYFQDGSGWGIFGQVYDANNEEVGYEFPVNTYTFSNQITSAIAGLPEGGFIVVWESFGNDGSSFGIFFQAYDINRNPVDGEVPVNTHTSNQQRFPAIATLTSGGFVIVWQSKNQDGSNWGVFSQMYDKDRNKVGDEFQINSLINDAQKNPKVACLPQGGFLVTWQSKNQDGSGWGVFAQAYDQNRNPLFDEDFQVNDFVTNHQSNPSAHCLSSKDIVIVWESKKQDGSAWGIFGKIYDQEFNIVKSEFLINSTTDNQQRFPVVTGLSFGGFVVVWSSFLQDGSGWGVFYQIYDHHYNKLGDETQVNENTLSHQYLPTVTSLSDGGFAVAWASLEGIDYYEIVGRTYDLIESI